MPTKPGTLFVVATPIGHPDEITLRALEVLSKVDLIICEERKIASRLLKQLEISKPLMELNEHNENEMVQEVLLKVLAGQNLALISDCGTPVFSDPGRKLLEIMYGSNIPVVPVSGPSSLMTAISVCLFDLKQFYFLGFLPPQTEQRKAVLQRHSNNQDPLILMDTPYRMAKLLEEVAVAFGKKQIIFLATDLTLPTERIYIGEVQEVQAQVQQRKAEFILIIGKSQRRRS
ncbi:MAG: 16S rRNA (cytidine(1402)-2'-O)-methyltransferase [Anaerolineaceae bacterium]